MRTTQYEDFMIAMALGNLSYRFEDADPELSAKAWSLAVTIAAEHGVTPSMAVRMIN